jgi:hypothetical protein
MAATKKYEEVTFAVRVYGDYNLAMAEYEKVMGVPEPFNPGLKYIKEWFVTPDMLTQAGTFEYLAPVQDKDGKILTGPDGQPLMGTLVMSEYEATRLNMRPSPLPVNSPKYRTKYPPVKLKDTQKVVWAVTPADTDGLMVENLDYIPPMTDPVTFNVGHELLLQSIDVNVKELLKLVKEK